MKDIKAQKGQVGQHTMNHDNVSFVKSGLRIIAGGVLVYAGVKYSSAYFVWAGGLIIGAELLGILEEIV